MTTVGRYGLDFCSLEDADSQRFEKVYIVSDFQSIKTTCLLVKWLSPPRQLFLCARHNNNKKGKVIPLQAECGPEGVYRCNSTLPWLQHEKGMSGQQYAPASLYPGKDPVPILQEAGWAPGSVWTGGKSRPTGIRSRTIQPVVSCYTDWANPH